MTTRTKALTVQQAADALGVPRRRISELIRRGHLKTEENPLDRRSKLISLNEIEKLAQLPRAPRRYKASARATSDVEQRPPAEPEVPGGPESQPRPRTFDMELFDPDLQSGQIDDYLREHWHPA